MESFTTLLYFTTFTVNKLFVLLKPKFNETVLRNAS